MVWVESLMRNHSFQPKLIVDKFLAAFRFSKVYQALNNYSLLPHQTKIIDMGSGTGLLIKQLRQKGYDAWGIDLTPGQNVIAADLNKILPVESNSIDIVTSLANIEHLEQPGTNLSEIYRMIKPGGKLILTTPSLAAKPILEFIAYKLKIIDPAEIRDHKFYYTKLTLSRDLAKVGFKNFKLSTFQLGLNLCVIAHK